MSAVGEFNPSAYSGQNGIDDIEPDWKAFAVAMHLQPIIQAILAEYTLPWSGYHGVAHWARVLENGRRLCEETGANLEILSLFALFHDSKRVNESTDPDHGQRGADFAKQLRGSRFELDDPEFSLLYRVREAHNTALRQSVYYCLLVATPEASARTKPATLNDDQ